MLPQIILFFFKQKTAYEILSGLVGSEMCIRDRFNSVPNFENKQNELWQRFCGVEIETDKDFFDDEIFNLMDFACEQRNKVHFFYTLSLIHI